MGHPTEDCLLRVYPINLMGDISDAGYFLSIVILNNSCLGVFKTGKFYREITNIFTVPEGISVAFHSELYLCVNCVNYFAKVAIRSF